MSLQSSMRPCPLRKAGEPRPAIEPLLGGGGVGRTMQGAQLGSPLLQGLGRPAPYRATVWGLTQGPFL